LVERFGLPVPQVAQSAFECVVRGRLGHVCGRLRLSKCLLGLLGLRFERSHGVGERSTERAPLTDEPSCIVPQTGVGELIDSGDDACARRFRGLLASRRSLLCPECGIARTRSARRVDSQTRDLGGAGVRRRVKLNGGGRCPRFLLVMDRQIELRLQALNMTRGRR
jgi:hypothetical protein